VAHEAFLAGSAQLGRGDKAGQQVQRPLGGQIEGALQAGKDADQKIVQTRQALGLPVDQIAAPADQQADLEVEFAGRLDRAQIAAGADLVGDGAGIARVGLVLAAPGALAGAVDRQARDVNEGEAGRGEHRLGQAGDAADHIQADADRAAELAKLGDELRDLARRIGQLAVDPHDAIGVDRGHPMHLLGNVDPDADPHGAPPAVEGSVSRPRRRRPTQRWIAEPNQRSRRCGGAGGSASRTIMGSQHENHPDTAAAPRSWHARIVVSGTAEAASRR